MNPDVIALPKLAIEFAASDRPTPFFLYEEAKIRSNCRKFLNSFRRYFPDFEALFAVKANANPHLLRIILDEEFGFDVSSYSEAWLAYKLKASGMYTGNYTTMEEFKMAEKAKLILNLDDSSAISSLSKIGIPQVISFRINPGIGQGGMQSLVTAGPEAKFGIPFEKAADAYGEAQKLGIKHFGIHMMTGSNVLDEKYFPLVVKKLLEVVALVKAKTGINIDFLDMGGGFGVPYHPTEKSLNLDHIALNVKKVFDEQCLKYNLVAPRLMAEPGRYIMANAGWLVSRVISLKNSYKIFMGIDASTNDMPRPAIYNAFHYITVLNRSKKKQKVSVVGRICENNDQFARDRLLPQCELGDLVVIHNCGAHAYAMGHNYNGRFRHSEYLLTLKNELQQIRRAETLNDLFAAIPDFSLL
ncbi:MAG: Diaminopimelate decarboxylase, diaminopimelate decarboxylase [Candidatus Peregrinibacteria bacterium GW2011_GWE2_39_6]|nr:MAG: Diaminopimelate decarboxylase, diaminopimelate decarboxylase [Candidatus Peregrinibacteria bacterium GW2011_GWF2_39_17]KKR25832.1 MAG: Diaminopimelate decarboxylase, diaminopimelate decarboxylase [Candidatus Peregrinibacteria bacterium GW2011_GWE2_39_6]HCW32262.1 diaminopimelate decarboxylase [Candidatus Peregrinibacteria bacterium]